MSWLRRGAGVAVREVTHKELRNRRFRGCLIKKPYTLEQAESRISGSRLTFYKCAFCDSHHLTSRASQDNPEANAK
jgi:hypothetical protein